MPTCYGLVTGKPVQWILVLAHLTDNFFKLENQWSHGRGQAGGQPPIACRKIFFFSENVLRKSIGRKGILTPKFRQPGWTEQSKVVSECILK